VALRYRGPTLFTPASRDLPGRRYAARVIAVGDPQDREIIGVVEVSRSTLATERFLSTLRRILLAALAAGLAMSALVSALLGRRLSAPIRDMEAATRRIAGGDLAVRLDHSAPDEIGRLAEGINHMAQQLKELEATRTRFISEVAHDLRTPLTGIKGLLVNLIDASGPDEAASLKIAEEETDRLIRLVNQLLDFSRWQAGRLELNTRPVDVGAVASSAVALCQERARHRDLTLKAEIPQDLPAVSADPDRLGRVILNLLDNAVKFTPAGGQVTLSVVARTSLLRDSTNGEIEVCVEDTGRGMTQEEQEHAFEAYYRGQRGGTGLGLSIARAIVEAHGGQMGLESQAGRGSRVWFRLPV
jgi:signal transduction histidine kinase